jgi:hypothetical protein
MNCTFVDQFIATQTAGLSALFLSRAAEPPEIDKHTRLTGSPSAMMSPSRMSDRRPI